MQPWPLSRVFSVADLMAGIVEGDKTIGEVLRIFLSVLAGKSSRMPDGTLRFRDLADTKDRVVATVDSSCNRLTITLDGE